MPKACKDLEHINSFAPTTCGGCELGSQIGDLPTSQSQLLKKWSPRRDSMGLEQWDMRARDWKDLEAWQ